MSDAAPETNQTEEQQTSRVILGVVIAFVVLGGLTYAAYVYSNRKGGAVYPAGYNGAVQPAAKSPTMANIDCANPDPAFKTHPNYYIKCDNYKESADTKWATTKNTVRGVKFDFPTDLKLVNFPNGYSYAWRTLPATGGLAISFDLGANRGGTYKTMVGEDYVRNYWKQFPGLTGLASIVPYETKAGVKGFQAVYKYGTETPTVDTFFEDPEVPGDFVHFSKGVLSDEVYAKLLDTFSWQVKIPATPAPAAPVASPKPQ